MFQETTGTVGKPHLVPPFLTYTDSLKQGMVIAG